MGKRAQFEIQFNWIFVLAVGAIILLFFSIVILKQKNVSDETTNMFVSRSIKAILVGAEVSADTVNFLDLPEVEINFECSKYRVGSGKSENIDIMSVFAPSKIKSSEMMTWTLDWNMPYRVTNFLYLTSPHIRYILVEDPAAEPSYKLARQISEDMPKEMNKELAGVDQLSNIKNEGDDKVRFVFFDTDVGDSMLSKFSRMNHKDITALKINGDGERGSVEFFEKDKDTNTFVSQGTSYYIKKPSLVGAVFADDIEVYNCAMENSFKKLKMVTSIYEEKTENLEDYYNNQGDSCRHYHSPNFLSEILTNSNKFDEGNIQFIILASKNLESQNKQAQLHSCALIY